MLCRKVLGQCRKKSVPALVADWRRLILQQRRLSPGRLPPVLLQELPHKLPTQPVMGRVGQSVGKLGLSHGAIARHRTSSESRDLLSGIQRCIVSSQGDAAARALGDAGQTVSR